VRLVLEKAATKGLRRMPSKTAKALVERLKAIAAAPFAHHADAKPLGGGKDWFRVRQGDWRALYRIDRSDDTVVVEDVLHRKDAYR
jgi:mRNA interferase RelE/StbE